MKVLLSVFFVLIFLVGCAYQEVPPSPPAPGSPDIVGRAGGIAIPLSQLPSWAAPPKHVSVYPTRAFLGETVTVSVGNVYAADNFDWVSVKGYLYDDYLGFWEPIEAFKAQSGPTTEDWARNRAGFMIDITQRRFEPGMQYLLLYGCRKVNDEWDCNNGPGSPGKWMLVAFEVQSEAEVGDISDYIFEADIGDYTFVESEVSSGRYEGSYRDAANDLVEVKVTPYASYDNLVADVSETGIWMPDLGGACGFFKSSPTRVKFWWAGGSFKVHVIAHTDSIPLPIIEEYADMYPADCDLNDDVTMPFCGDGHKDAGEQCDLDDDSACPGDCLLDCTCPAAGGAPVCGDLIIEGSEECEEDSDCGAGEVCDDCECVSAAVCGDSIVTPPEDCEVDVHCDVGEVCEDCVCVVVSVCGDGITESGEECESDVECAVDEFCYGCSCLPAQAICHNNITEPSEECETDAECSAGEVCDDCTCIIPYDYSAVTVAVVAQQKDVVKDADQYLLFFIAAFAILILTAVNFVEFRK